MPPNPLDCYTQAELDAIALARAGCSYQEGADMLGITKNAFARRIRRARLRQAEGRKPLVRVHEPRR
jgi:DNA-directed RNA polymerase specialized sigma24 family protein